LGLLDVPLTNNVAETSNFLFKKYLKQTGPPCNNLNKKKPYEVLLASKFYLETEWHLIDLSKYQQEEIEIKEQFKSQLEKSSKDLPPYQFQTPKDIIKEIKRNHGGTFSLISLS